MQHNDGTWSHKPGSLPVTNKSLEDEETRQLLTNSNIQSLANKGPYENGCLKFFVVTRDAVLDHPHVVATGTMGPKNILEDDDTAGEYWQTAVESASYYQTGRFDFTKDLDVFYFDCLSSGWYEVWINTDSMEGVTCGIYDSSGFLLSEESGEDLICVECYLSSGLRYYLKLRDSGGNTSYYAISIY